MNDAGLVGGDVRLPAGGYMAENGVTLARRFAASTSTSNSTSSEIAATAAAVAPPVGMLPATVPPPLVLIDRERERDRDLITLNQPRPGVARARNEYIETPLRPPQLPFGKVTPPTTTTTNHRKKTHEDSNANNLELRRALVHQNQNHHHLHQGPRQQPPSTAPRPPLPTNASGGHTTPEPPVGVHGNLSGAVGTWQARRPIRNNTQACVTFKKEKPEVPIVGPDAPVLVGGGVAHARNDLRRSECDAESIICSECERCKCEACRTPRPLPSAWVCGDKYLCSADTTLDYCSCMCCVKGLFYHYTKDYDLDSDDPSCADEPCSCEPSSNRCVRWSAVAGLSLLLPCLLCYWPLKGCMRLCEGCYARYHSRGCQCVHRRRIHEEQILQQPKSTKRLLDTGHGHLADG